MMRFPYLCLVARLLLLLSTPIAALSSFADIFDGLSPTCAACLDPIYQSCVPSTNPSQILLSSCLCATPSLAALISCTRPVSGKCLEAGDSARVATATQTWCVVHSDLFRAQVCQAAASPGQQEFRYIPQDMVERECGGQKDTEDNDGPENTPSTSIATPTTGIQLLPSLVSSAQSTSVLVTAGRTTAAASITTRNDDDVVQETELVTVRVATSTATNRDQGGDDNTQGTAPENAKNGVDSGAARGVDRYMAVWMSALAVVAGMFVVAG